MPFVCFVCIRLTSDAQIKIVREPNKYRVEEHWGPKFKKVVPNATKVIYAMDMNVLSISKKIILLQTDNL